MNKILLMPRLSESMDKGVIVSIEKQLGDIVEKGEVLYEVETEKVVSAVEAPVTGKVVEIFCEEGDEISVDHKICSIEVD